MKYTVLTILALFLLPGTALSGGHDKVPEEEEEEIAGISNFSRITGAPGFAGYTVGFGGATEASAMPAIKAEGFATVINLRSSTEEGADVAASRAAAKSAGLNYINLPFDPKSATSADVQAVLAALGEPANQPVYLHCGSGTRAASLFMIGRVQKDRWDIEAASTEAASIAGKPAEAIAFSSGFLAAQRDQ